MVGVARIELATPAMSTPLALPKLLFYRCFLGVPKHIYRLKTRMRGVWLSM
jgi:hypothetical protein